MAAPAAGAAPAAAADTVAAVVDLSKLVLQNSPKLKGLKTGIQLDLSGLVITHGQTEHNSSARGNERPEGRTLLVSELPNTTDREQTLTLKTDREMMTSYKVNMTRYFTIEDSLSLSVSPPQSALTAGIGAKRSLQLSGKRETTDTDVTRWSLDTNVAVPSGRRTKVTVSLVEEEMTSSFTVLSTISGRVVIPPVDKKGKPDPKSSPTVIDDVRTVFLERDGFQKLENQPAVTFKSSGIMYCRFGVTQEVRFDEVAVGEQMQPKP